MDVSTLQQLKVLFYSSCYDIGVKEDRLDAVWAGLGRYYKDRPFHGWNHICFVASAAINYFSEDADNISEIITSVVFHDVIQDAGPGKNEKKSTDYARRALKDLGVEGDVIDRIEGNIMATVCLREDLKTKDQKIISDCDLMGYGRPQEEFIKETRSIWLERGQPDIKEFYKAESGFAKLLRAQKKESGGFYYFPKKIQEYEDRARENTDMIIDREQFYTSFEPVLKL